jgi:hypothetical protein
VLQLVDYGRIRVMADRLGIESADREAQVVVFKFRPQAKVDPTRLVQLIRQRAGLSLSPPVTLKLDLKAAAQAGRAPAAAATSGGHPSAAAALGPREHLDKASVSGPKSKARSPKSLSTGASWWTTRATSGTVEPGFSRDEIMRPQKEDPRGPHGVLTLVGDLLAALQ